jgi:alpha-acetolactate decarboxylase
MVYLIAYRLNKPGQDYSNLDDAIRKVSGIYWHHTTSSWLVESTLSAKQVFEKLHSFIDKNDELVVFRLQGEYWGHLPDPKNFDWLKARQF